jgi:hypothetical protein
MAALAGLVEVDEVVIRLLCQAPRGLVVLTGKDAHGSRDGDAGGVVKAELIPTRGWHPGRRMGRKSRLRQHPPASAGGRQVPSRPGLMMDNLLLARPQP